MEQIRYHSYSDELKPEHKNYWSDIDQIARLIALQLEGYCTSYRKNKHDFYKFDYADKSTTITVQQYKEKFGSIRVYWTPVNPELVEQKYKELCEYNTKFNKPQISLEDFRERCLIQDILHYRNTYFSMKSLFPQYWSAMYDGADNHEYLIETKEEYLELVNEELKDKPEGKFFTRYKDEVFKILNWG